MDELIATCGNIDDLLQKAGDMQMSDRHFHSQMLSFVAGNAFDVFKDTKTVTARSIKHTEKIRRNITR